jgi:hypothetical protein
MTARTRPSSEAPVRVRTAHVAWLDERLSARDWAVMEEVNRLRVVSGQQLERLCFAQLQGRSRTVTRSRVLARLVRQRVLVALERRVGGSGRGSSGAVFALDTAGRRLLVQRRLAEATPVRVRRPGTPGERGLRHMLAVSELYVQLVEQTRTDPADRCTFRAEPGSWWPDGRGGRLKPDAYVLLERPGVQDHWWIEVDLATESLPTIRSKVKTYTDYQARDGRGPDEVMPWVLIATVTPKRRAAIQTALRKSAAANLVTVVELKDAAAHMARILHGP